MNIIAIYIYSYDNNVFLIKYVDNRDYKLVSGNYVQINSIRYIIFICPEILNH